MEFQAVVESLPEPNQYQVRLKWPSDPQATAWAIQRGESDRALNQLAMLESPKTEYIDPNVKAGQIYKYVLGRLEGSTYSVRKELSLAVPMDLEVKPGTEARDISTHRLFFRNGAKLVTHGRAIRITAEEIISENGIIETFAGTPTARAQNPGRSGGSIAIRARRGRGILTILMRGENGGQGPPGSRGTGAGSKGPRGNDGACGREDDGFHCSEVTREYLDRVRADPARAGLSPFQRERYLQNFHCRTQTGDGGQGSPGGPGAKGGAGPPGGDSGSLAVDIEDPTHLEVRPTIAGGRGGVGGDGGPGGPGGPGGDPGQTDHLGLCRVASPGPPGPEGPTGQQGESGPDGRTQGACLRLGNARSGDGCSPFARELVSR